MSDQKKFPEVWGIDIIGFKGTSIVWGFHRWKIRSRSITRVITNQLKLGLAKGAYCFHIELEVNEDD